MLVESKKDQGKKEPQSTIVEENQPQVDHTSTISTTTNKHTFLTTLTIVHPPI